MTTKRKAVDPWDKVEREIQAKADLSLAISERVEDFHLSARYAARCIGCLSALAIVRRHRPKKVKK